MLEVLVWPAGHAAEWAPRRVTVNQGDRKSALARLAGVQHDPGRRGPDFAVEHSNEVEDPLEGQRAKEIEATDQAVIGTENGQMGLEASFPPTVVEDESKAVLDMVDRAEIALHAFDGQRPQTRRRDLAKLLVVHQVAVRRSVEDLRDDSGVLGVAAQLSGEKVEACAPGWRGRPRSWAPRGRGWREGPAEPGTMSC